MIGFDCLYKCLTDRRHRRELPHPSLILGADWKIHRVLMPLKCVCKREVVTCTHIHEGNVRQCCASCVLQTERRLGKIWARVSPWYTHARAHTETHTPMQAGKWDVRVSKSRWWHCRHCVASKVNTEKAIFLLLVTVYKGKRGRYTPHMLVGRRITALSCKAQTAPVDPHSLLPFNFH